jgi:hypothetical protein
VELQEIIKLGDTGLEHPPLVQAKTPISTSSSAKSDAQSAPKAVKYPDLDAVVKAWPELPEHIKKTIKTLIEAHITASKD